jgi:hypothetical protein
MSNKNSSPSGQGIGAQEFIRQFSTQAALLSGFAFAGLTAISYDPSSPHKLVTAFGVCASLSIAANLLALFMLGLISVMASQSGNYDAYDPEIMISWIAFIIGIATFLAAVTLIVWIKIRPAALPVTIVVILVGAAMVVSFFKISAK